ncbi:hypothetical protein OIU79_030830 [Salix purpurea]|uniref:Uncharacterized protein n=1 Tax=Salix purpurea TaxID=77065 RepID=A0A9Q0ZS00_SALPP|nr:hypothetical protein OIU79_030830 [Salix purpurea]
MLVGKSQGHRNHHFLQFQSPLRQPAVLELGPGCLSKTLYLHQTKMSAAQAQTRPSPNPACLQQITDRPTIHSSSLHHNPPCSGNGIFLLLFTVLEFLHEDHPVRQLGLSLLPFFHQARPLLHRRRLLGLQRRRFTTFPPHRHAPKEALPSGC